MKYNFSYFLNNIANSGAYSSLLKNVRTETGKLFKSISIFLIVSIIGLRSYSQLDSLEHKFFDNYSIHYDIIYVSHSVLSKESSHISKHYIRIRMSKNYKEHLLAKDTTFWLEHLRGENSDWATNLILYYLFDRDAATMIIYDKREKWLKIKKDEIGYWKKFLSVPHPYSTSSIQKMKRGNLYFVVTSETPIIIYSSPT